MNPFKSLEALRDDISGATAVEYGLILALMFLAMVGAVESVGTEITSTWNDVNSQVSDSSAKAREG